LNYPNHITADEIARIETWLDGEMPPEQAAAFAAQLRADTLLQQKVDETRLLLLGVKEAALKSHLNTFHANLPGAAIALNKAVVRPLRIKLLVAAGLLAAVSLLALWQLRGNSVDQLYSTYYKPDPGLMTAMGNSNNYVFEKAMVSYKEGDYKKAIEEWLPLQASQPANDTLAYFLGSAYQAYGAEEKAIAQYQKLVLNKQQAFYSITCWYLGLALLKQNKINIAIDYLKKSNHFQSTALITTLNKK
jgi:tetratricopeptide (TPR) repeat protein